MRRRRTIYFNDARHYYLFVFEPPMKLEDVWRPIDEVAATPVDTFVYGVARGDGDDHPQPHVEGAIHLRRRDVALALQPVESWGDWQRVVNDIAEAGDHAGQVLEPPPGNVRQRVHVHRREQRQYRANVDARRRNQLRTEGRVAVE